MSEATIPAAAYTEAPPKMEGAEGSADAEYALEMPVSCPQCNEEIESVHVVRALRVKVNFVSTLPRRGQLLVCPKCQGVLGGSLGGVI